MEGPCNIVFRVQYLLETIAGYKPLYMGFYFFVPSSPTSSCLWPGHQFQYAMLTDVSIAKINVGIRWLKRREEAQVFIIQVLGEIELFVFMLF